MRESIQHTSLSALPAANPAQERLQPSNGAARKSRAHGDADFATSLNAVRPELAGEPADEGSMAGAPPDAGADPRFVIDVEAGSPARPTAHNDRGLNHTGFTNALSASGRFSGAQTGATRNEPARTEPAAASAGQHSAPRKLALPVARPGQHPQLLSPRSTTTDAKPGSVSHDLRSGGAHESDITDETLAATDSAAATVDAVERPADRRPLKHAAQQTPDPVATDAPPAAAGLAEPVEHPTEQSALADTGGRASAVQRQTGAQATDRATSTPFTTGQNAAGETADPSDLSNLSDAQATQADSVINGSGRPQQGPDDADQAFVRPGASAPVNTPAAATGDGFAPPVEQPDTTPVKAQAAPDERAIPAETHHSKPAKARPAGATQIARAPDNRVDMTVPVTVPAGTQNQPVSAEPNTNTTPEPGTAKLKPARRTPAADPGRISEDAGSAKDPSQAETIIGATGPTGSAAASTENTGPLATAQHNPVESMAGTGGEPEAVNGPGENRAELPAIDQPLDPDNVDEVFQRALGDRLITAVRQDMNRAEIRVTPAELGPITIELSVDGDSASIVFTADQNNTRSALQDSLQSLREHLREEGISLTEASVSDQKSSQPGTGERDANGDERQAGRSPANNGASPEQSNAGPYRQPVREQGLVDLFA